MRLAKTMSPIPRTYKRVTLHGKRDRVLKGILKWGGDLGFSRSSVIREVLISRRGRRAGEDVVIGAEVGAMHRRMWAALDAGEEKEVDSPLEPPEGAQPCWYLEFRRRSLLPSRTVR